MYVWSNRRCFAAEDNSKVTEGKKGKHQVRSKQNQLGFLSSAPSTIPAEETTRTGGMKNEEPHR